MSDNGRQQPNEGQGNMGQNENHEPRQYEGFEGMNYEQRRQPYTPQKTSGRDSEEGNGGHTGKRRDEM